MTNILDPQQNDTSLWQRLKGYMVTVGTISTFLSLYWGTIWKILFALAVGSIHLWGNNNWYEQITEAVNKWVTGVDVNISEEVSKEQAEPKDLKKYIPNER